jgi:serine/threonine protein kinase/WD40 repeat protein
VPRTGSNEVEPEIPLEREGQYTRLEELGRGGQSVVVRAFDEFVAREVALKELTVERAPEPSTSSERGDAARRRFLREARLTARLDHPGIVSVLELARRTDGTVFCAQKLIRGETLKKRLERCASLPDRLQLLPHLIDACQAVAYAHAHGVIHRDLKPSNIMVGSFGETVVVDWGLAKASGESAEPDMAELSPTSGPGTDLTRTGLAMGTPGYMSPEQARGEGTKVDERSDVFSLGVVLYELLTGRIPFDGATTEHIVETLLIGRFHPVRRVCPEAPPELAAISDRALEFHPDRRYPSAGALASELAAYASGGRVHAYRYRPWELVKKFVAANRSLSVVALAAFLILAASVANVFRQLQATRLTLANSFLERARAAESVSDWGRAAGYYAASRVEHDSQEARWGVSLARQRIVPRILTRRGRQDAYVDAGFDENGQPWVLARESGAILARSLMEGRELWRIPEKDASEEATILRGGVELRSRTQARYVDPATGRVTRSFDSSKGFPCAFGPLVSEVLWSDSTGSWRIDGTAGARPLSSTQSSLECAMSDDGSRFAARDKGGVVRVWNTSTGEEIDRRPASDAAQVFFTPHGVAIVRARSIQVFGGPEGDFSVDVPARSGFGISPGGIPWKANVRSPDGHRLAIAGLKTGQADLVDLGERRVLASLSYPHGVPRFAFSPDGERLIASGLVNGSALIEWDLRPRVLGPSVHGSRFMTLRMSSDGHRFVLFHFDRSTSRYEIFDDRGARLLEDRVNGAWNVALSGDGRRIAVSDGGAVELRDVDGGRRLQRFACENCKRLNLSGDGSRVLTGNAKGWQLWDASTGEQSGRETARFGSLSEALQLSPDGQTVAWAVRSTLFIHEQSSGRDRELHLDGRPGEPGFSHSGNRLAVATDGTLAVYSLSDLHPLWQVAKSSWVPTGVWWSSDDSVVLLFYESLGTVLHDARTGQRIATIAPAKPGAFNTQENVLPDLRHRITRGNETWELSALPQPDAGKPSETLAQVLREAGLQLRGAELVDVLTLPPGPGEAPTDSSR